MGVLVGEGKEPLDEGSLSSLPLLVGLIALHALVEFAYTSLTNYRRTPMQDRAEAGEIRARRILNLTADLPRLHITTQLVLGFIRVAVIVITALAIIQPLINAQAASENPIGAEWIYLAVLVPLALVIYAVGSLLPSAFGIAYADQVVSIVAFPMQVAMTLLSPLSALMASLSRTAARISGGEDILKAVTEEEILSLVDVGQRGGTIENEEKEMIYSVLQFGETLAREVMVPRPDISGVEVTTPLREALEVFIESGHSRIPVYEETIDDIKGLLYAKDILAICYDSSDSQPTIQALMRPAHFIPETKRADDLFREMQERKIHIAIVVDEYGGTAGLVTIEDLLEEIVGDIRDEYDENEEIEFLELGDNTYLVDGGMNLDDLNELLETHLPTIDSDSVGGYIYSVLGHVPEVGEVIETDYLTMRVESVENRRIRKVHMTRTTPQADDEHDDESGTRNGSGKNGKRENGKTADSETRANTA